MAFYGRMGEQTAADGARIAHYHVTPEDMDRGSRRRGALVLIQEIFGVTDHIKELCDSFAWEGFEVIAPALFDRQEPGFAVDYAVENIQRARVLADQVDWDGVTADVAASVALLADKGPVFVMGYCFGGTVSWVAAARVPGIAAASGYYGRLIVDFVDEAPQCPIILHFGTQDTSIPMETVQRIEMAHPTVPVYRYDAGHGFNSDRRADYDPDCAALARERTLALFTAHGAK